MRAPAVLCLWMLCALTACSGWPSQPYSYVPPTSFPTRTPRIQTPTPVILSPTPATSTAETGTPTTPVDTITPTVPTPSETPTTEPSPTASIKVDILGCDTGIDILHGMGEVTNAYVTISNPGSGPADDLCATLQGLDEARQHPDKTKCVPSLPAGYQVTLKLTVDTTYKVATPVQIEVSSGETFLGRAGEAACTAIGTLLPGAELGAIEPIGTP